MRRAETAQARARSLRQARGCGGFRSRRAEGLRAHERAAVTCAAVLRQTSRVCVLVAARLSSAASPGEGGAAFPGRATGDKDDPQWTIQRQSRRFRFAASPVTGDAGPGLPLHRPSLFRGPRGCSYPETAKRPRAARPLSHVKQVGPGPQPVPGFSCGPSGLGDPREALLLGGAVTGRAGAEGPALWPPLGPRLRDPRPAAGKCFWFCVRLGPGTGIPLQGVGV